MAITGFGTMREELQGTSVDALFQRGEADRLISRPKAQEDLEKIAKSERGDHRLRVLAHELLVMLGKDPDPKMVRIYCEAISGAFMHNWWGLPGVHLGKFGATLIRFGEPAIPYLVKEMDDPTLLTALGPDAPQNRERHNCVGDLATYLVCTILGIPYPGAPEPEVREPSRIQLMKELSEKLAADKRK
jgi:hypothetical protein